MFYFSGEWSGHSQSAHVCGAICGAETTETFEETKRTV